MPESDPTGLAPTLRALLVCPECRGELEASSDTLGCRVCRRQYPVVEGVPHLIPEAATRWLEHLD